LLRHVARLVARLIVDYFTSRRLVVDYFAYVVRPGASVVAWLVAPLVVDYCDYVTRPGASARRAARRRLLRLCRASGCLGTLRGS
jgi:hypothetical protein